MWSRAVWREGDREEEGVVPDTWLSDNRKLLRWPNTSNAERSIKERWSPEESWWSFDIVKVKCITDNKRDADNYTLTSSYSQDSSDSEETISRRKKQRKEKAAKIYSDFLTGKEMEKIKTHKQGAKPTVTKTPADDEFFNSLPKVMHDDEKYACEYCGKLGTFEQKLKCQQDHLSKMMSDEKLEREKLEREKAGSMKSPPGMADGEDSFKGSTQRSSQSGSATNAVVPATSGTGPSGLKRKTAREKHVTSGSGPSGLKRKKFVGITSGNVQQRKDLSDDDLDEYEEPKRASDVFPMSNAKFQKKMMYLLMDIKNDIKLLKRQLDDGEEDMYMLESMVEAYELEDSLQNREAKRELVAKMSRIGGKTLQDIVYRIVKSLFSNSLMAQINMVGSHGMVGMYTQFPTILSAIKAAIPKKHNGKDSKVEDLVRKCLKHGAYRKGGPRYHRANNE